MMTTNRPEDRAPRTRSTPVIVGIGWAASLVGYLGGRALITALGPAAGWFNLLLVIILPVLSALIGTLVTPPAWLRGRGGVLRHALIVVPVPLVLTLLSAMSMPSQVITVTLVLMMVGIMVVGTLLGAVIGRLLRRDPDRDLRANY